MTSKELIIFPKFEKSESLNFDLTFLRILNACYFFINSVLGGEHGTFSEVAPRQKRIWPSFALSCKSLTLGSQKLQTASLFEFRFRLLLRSLRPLAAVHPRDGTRPFLDHKPELLVLSLEEPEPLKTLLKPPLNRIFLVMSQALSSSLLLAFEKWKKSWDLCLFCARLKFGLGL